MDDFDARVQRRCEEHLAACQDAMFDGEGDETFEQDSPAFGPFCGCNTCVVREVLLVAWDEMLAEARRQA